MLIYAGTKSDFMIDTENDRLETKLYENIKLKMNRTTGLSELNAWRNSLKEMYITLNDSDIPKDAGVAIEYNIPQTSKRVDFLISGYGLDGKGNVVIVELKQWEKLTAIDGQDAIVETYTGGANRRVVHPCYQAWSYAALIRDYNEYVQDNEIGLHPCAYLHNYPRIENDPLDKEQYQNIMEETPAFTYGQREALRRFIKKQIVTGDKEDTLLKIEHGKIKPSKQLQDALANMLKGNQEFVMLDEQKVVYESILDYSCQCQKDGKKRTIIVEGGPGTGKTVIAINLLAELTNRMQFVQYVSKNAAPRTVYQLLECFQWSDTEYNLQHIKEELADVLVYTQNLLDKLELDADEIVNMKMKQNEAKYPVDEVLQCLWIHSRFCHIRTIRMSAYMRCNVWHLHPVDIIVSADHMIETMLPVHCHKWHSIIIVKQESTISIYGFLHFRCISVLNNCLKHLCHIFCNRQYSCSGIRLCGFYDVSHIRCSLQLVVNIYSSVLKINVLQRQATKFRYSHSRMK